MRAIGLMSGTSLDGVDVALIETDGERILGFGPVGYRPYTDPERELLRAALAAGPAISDRRDRSGVLGKAQNLIDETHAEIIETLFADNGISPADVDVIGFHGQTVIHKPKEGLTAQLGDGSKLAERLGVPVIHDLRQADVAAGGQGAPVVPVFHRALVHQAGLERPAAILNIGGVANVSWVGTNDEIVAFDTGPGNALLDDLMRARTGAPFDRDGELARQGTTDRAVLAELLTSSYFLRTPPKSLDRNHFHEAALAAVEALSTPDAAATLVEFTAESIALSVQHMPALPKQWVIAGGGARNLATLAALRARLPVPVMTAEEVGWSIDALEAQAFAFLAARSLTGRPNTLPSTTGAPFPVVGGVLALPSRLGEVRRAAG